MIHVSHTIALTQTNSGLTFSEVKWPKLVHGTGLQTSNLEYRHPDNCWLGWASLK